MSPEEFEQVRGLDESLLVGIYNLKSAEIDAKDNESKYEELRHQAWKDNVMERVMDDDEATKTSHTHLQTLLIDGGFILGENIQAAKGGISTGKKVGVMLKLDASACVYISQLVSQHKKELADKWDAENIKTKKVSGGGGKRSKFSGEKRETNTAETAEGKDNQFYFEGDETATFTKPTFTAKDGTYQNITHKAVKHKRYMGGAESKVSDGKCIGAVGWDRAQGSLAIKATGLSYAQVRIRCDETPMVAGNFCAKCECKADKANFFSGEYKITKGSGVKFNGVKYKQFIVDNLKYGAVSK